jgi:hypothetical protein
MSTEDPKALASSAQAASGDRSGAPDAGSSEVAAAPRGEQRVGVATHEWTTEAADRIESAVAAVRDRTTVPVVKLARFVVFGVVAVPLVVVAVILFVVGLARLIEVYLPIEPYSSRVWGTYAVLGAIFVAVGLFLFSRRTRHRE